MAHQQALDEMSDRAQRIRSYSLIGVKMDYEVLGETNGMLMVTCSGIAVKIFIRV